MKLKNTSSINNDLVKEVLRFVMPAGVTRMRIRLTKTRHTYSGRGGRYDVLLRLNPKARYPRFYRPYQYGCQKGRKWAVANLTEMLVILAAHELRHAYQARATTRRGYAWGARGRYSEVDTEAYALRMLRAWRRSRPACLADLWYNSYTAKISARRASLQRPALAAILREQPNAAPVPSRHADVPNRAASLAPQLLLVPVPVG